MIRRFQPSDMDDVIDIWMKASIEAHGFVERAFWESKTEEMRKIYIPASETHVFSENGIVKGFFSIQDNILAAIFVSPDAQGRGIGRQLLEKAKSLRRSLTLAVYRENLESFEFYKKNGFIVLEERIDGHTGHKEILMLYRP